MTVEGVVAAVVMIAGLYVGTKRLDNQSKYRAMRQRRAFDRWSDRYGTTGIIQRHLHDHEDVGVPKTVRGREDRAERDSVRRPGAEGYRRSADKRDEKQ